MTTHIVTQIKREVDEAKMRQYSINKDKKQLRYYSLYLKQVVLIQRYFRKFLIRKTKVLQRQISTELQKKQLSYFSFKNISQQLDQQLKRRKKLRNQNIQKNIKNQKQNICLQMKEMIKNVVNCADKYAKNAAISKICIDDLQELKRQEKQLEAEVRELQLQKQCYEQRVQLWNVKLKEIREKVIEELSIKRKLERDLKEIQDEEQN